MHRKCHTCLCRTCLTTCGKCMVCQGKTESCERYCGFKQLSIFDQQPKSQYQSVPRHSWKHYGITKERYRQLMECIRSGRHDSLALQAAHTANETLSEYILLSIKKNLSYEGLEKLWGRGEIERIPYGRTDFYGIRRYAMHLFDEKLKEIGK